MTELKERIALYIGEKFRIVRVFSNGFYSYWLEAKNKDFMGNEKWDHVEFKYYEQGSEFEDALFLKMNVRGE